MNIEEKINGYLNEVEKYIKKGIYTEQGRKIEGERQAKMFLGFEDSEGLIKNVTWKEFKKSKLPDNLNNYVEKEFINSLMKQLKNFGKKIDYNAFCRGVERTFEEKADWLLKNGAKYTKRGLK
jgi:hypothetical protein